MTIIKDSLSLATRGVTVVVRVSKMSGMELQPQRGTLTLAAAAAPTLARSRDSVGRAEVEVMVERAKVAKMATLLKENILLGTIKEWR